MNLQAVEDTSLVRRAIDGDEKALDALYDRYADSLFAFICHQLNETRSDAEDVWQDTWMAALRSLQSYRGQSRLFTWLCGIARHKMADHWRRRGRPVQVLSDVAPQQLATLLEAGPLPEDLLMQSAMRAHVVQALAELPEDYRMVLVARYGDGMGVGEVAQRLGRTYKATESLLSRAKSAFRQTLAGLDQGV